MSKRELVMVGVIVVLVGVVGIYSFGQATGSREDKIRDRLELIELKLELAEKRIEENLTRLKLTEKRTGDNIRLIQMQSRLIDLQVKMQDELEKIVKSMERRMR